MIEVQASDAFEVTHVQYQSSADERIVKPLNIPGAGDRSREFWINISNVLNYIEINLNKSWDQPLLGSAL